MATRPTNLPRWAVTTGGVPASNLALPTSAKRDVGWADQEQPPAGIFNELQYENYQWIQWFNSRRTIAATWGSTNPVLSAGTPVYCGEFALNWTNATPPALTNANAAYGSGSIVTTTPAMNDNTEVLTTSYISFPSATISTQINADLSMSAIGANDLNVLIGSFNGIAGTGATGGAAFRKLTTDTNWQCQTDDGVTPTITSSGVPPVANTIQSFEIRQYGNSRVEFYINGALVATNTTNINTTNAMRPIILVSSAAGTAHTVRIGAFSFAW